MTEAIWYFDFISPLAYLQFSRLCQLPPDLHVTIKRVLFSGLLEHRAQRPGRDPSKRRFVYRFVRWLAAQPSVPFNMPPT
jgi:2-hydroxychromene-2-carboxylate isomerase